jgi:HPt (histidine-containing phosphotransfer) domain-containing protein
MSLPPIRSQLADDPDYAELVSEFVSNIPLRILSIRKSMEQNDSNQLCTLIHQLKGACGSYGFHEVTPQATILEEQLRSGATMTALVDRLEEFLETCQRLTADPV